jgi:hypothetical protein
MTRTLVLAVVAWAASPFAAPAFAAGTTELALLGNAGTAEVFSCYERRYDEDHLQSHPHQNVRGVKLFFDSYVDKDSGERINLMSLGWNFRKLKAEFQTYGECATLDGAQSLGCGADCDGGHFDVTAAGGVETLLLKVPDYVRIDDPTLADSDDPSVLPKGAALGSDDKEFRLAKVDLKECRSLMNDDQVAAIFGSKTASAR